MTLSALAAADYMKLRLPFQVKLFLSLVAFSCLLLALLGVLLFHFIDRQLHHDLGQRASTGQRNCPDSRSGRKSTAAGYSWYRTTDSAAARQRRQLYCDW
jgi:hypothetical protein